MYGDYVHVGLACGKLIISKDSGQLIVYESNKWSYITSFRMKNLDLHIESDIYYNMLFIPIKNGKIVVRYFS